MIEQTYTETMARLSKKLRTLQLRAINRGMECDLDLYILSILLSKKCIYCGNDATGLDRKDNEVGYTVNNVVPSCHRCNGLKGSKISFEDMLVIGYEIQQCEAGDDEYYLDDGVYYEFS